METIKAAAYCRVSTDKEVQEGSYECQEQHFRDMISRNPEMELVGIYGDKGKSGLSMKKRPGLQKLLNDCRAGKANLILTKSISRFARNMAECAQMLRELGGLGVNVFFEEQNLSSQDEKTSLILNIFSAIAQEESHSISLHATRAHEQYALEGRPFGRIAFGYRNAGENKWVIDENEAPTVREAFRLAREGKCYKEIQKSLNRMEKNGYQWSQKRLKYMLTNVVYKGDYFSNQTVCLVPGKQIANQNYRDRIYIEGHHPPLIPRDAFDRVQLIVHSGLLVSKNQRGKKDELFAGGVRDDVQS